MSQDHIAWITVEELAEQKLSKDLISAVDATQLTIEVNITARGAISTKQLVALLGAISAILALLGSG